jgi:hypothetical protein
MRYAFFPFIEDNEISVPLLLRILNSKILVRLSAGALEVKNEKLETVVQRHTRKKAPTRIERSTHHNNGSSNLFTCDLSGGGGELVGRESTCSIYDQFTLSVIPQQEGFPAQQFSKLSCVGTPLNIALQHDSFADIDPKNRNNEERSNKREKNVLVGIVVPPTQKHIAPAVHEECACGEVLFQQFARNISFSSVAMQSNTTTSKSLSFWYDISVL